MDRKSYQGLWQMLFALGMVISVIFHPAALQAASLEDAAPIIVPNNSNGKQVLFDNTHGQTAGQADWVIDGAFSDFAEGIAERGYQVEELRSDTPLQLDDLIDYDVFVIPEANIPFKQEEQAAMIDYVHSGGSIFFISDHYNADRNKNRWDSSEIMNGFRRGAYDNPTKGMSAAERDSEAMQGVESSDWLSDNFGIRFRFNAPGTVVADHTVEPSESFGITEGVEQVTMHAGSTMAITNPDLAKGIVYLPDNLTEKDKWGPAVDEGIYHGGGVAEGPYAAIAKVEKGKAAFIGDSSPVEDATPKYRNEETGKTKRTYDGFTDADNGVLLVQMIDWLAEEEDYETFTETDIPLDEVSPMLEKEIPEKTTEPQFEPWSTPLEGYHWYDSATFAPGSYGSNLAPGKEPIFTLTHTDPIPSDRTFEVEVNVKDLAPNQKISELTFGMYLDGGQQIAKVQNQDGSWPKSFGYSEPFTMTADENGQAKTTLTIQLNEQVKDGEVRLRLRQGKTNLVTNNAMIGEIATEEPITTMSIRDARQQVDGEQVAVTGVVTTTPGFFGGKGFYVQDESAGIYVFQHDSNLEVGDEVEIVGSMATFQSKRELTNIEKLTVIGKADLPAFAEVDKLEEAVLGERIAIEGVIEEVSSYSNAFEFTLVNESAETTVRVDNRTGLTIAEFEKRFSVGDAVTVQGIASIFKNNYQLLLIDWDNIFEKEVPSSAPVVELTEDFSQFVITKEYQLPIHVYDVDDDLTDVSMTINGEEIGSDKLIEPLDFVPGTYELEITAYDAAGHVTEVAYPLEAVLELDQLDELVVYGSAFDYFDEKMEKRLLKQAIQVQEAPNNQARENKFDALLKQIDAQVNKKIDVDFRDYWATPIDLK